MYPAAQGGAFARVFHESQRAQTPPKRNILRIGCDFRDRINVEGRAWFAGCLVRDQQTRDRPPTNTSSSSNGCRSWAAIRNLSRFESVMSVSKSPAKLALGD